MTRAIETATGFAHWASYLINGDHGDMSEADIAQADQFAEYCGNNITGCSDETFFARPEFPNDCLLGDCIEFTYLTEG